MPINKTTKIIEKQNEVNKDLKKITDKIENIDIEGEKEQRQVKIKPLKFKF